MPAGKQAVVWQDKAGQLMVTVVASDKAVTQQHAEIDAAGCRYLGTASVLNVDSSRDRRAAPAGEPPALMLPFTVITAVTVSGLGDTSAVIRAWAGDDIGADAIRHLERYLGDPDTKSTVTGGSIDAAVITAAAIAGTLTAYAPADPS